MLSKETFGLEHIRKLQKNSGRDPVLIERVLYAFGLLEALVRVEMPFVFKGGTCLMLLLDEPMRLSTDIDIIVEPETDIDDYIQKASEIFPFRYSEEQKRVGKNKIVKRHFKFFYPSPITDDEFHIILDVLFEENNYLSVITKEINNSLLILSEEERCNVIVPNVNCILGDKLTAFAPHTTGIPIGIGKEQEIMKQLFDVATLLDAVDDFTEVKETYRRIAAEEISYRGLDITYKEALMDTIRAASCIIGKGHTDEEEFPLYMSGAKAVASHIFQERYSGEKAVFQACKVLCLAAYVLADEDEMIQIVHPEDYVAAKISMKEYSKLSYIRKLKLESFGYLVEGVQALEEIQAL